MRKLLVSTALIALTGLLIGAASPASQNALDIQLTPRSNAGVVAAIDVEETLHQPSTPAGGVLLRMPIIATMAPGALQNPKSLTARDDSGALPLTIVDNPPDPSNFQQDRRWLASRATRGAVVVHYSATPRAITPTTRPGPLVDVRTEGAGVYGAMITLLALPENAWPRPVSLHWNLKSLPEGSRVGTSLGEGDQTALLRRDQLTASFFMAGPLHSIPQDGQGNFVVYWITPPAWDLAGAAEWTHKAYDYFARFWDYPGHAFRVFMRTTQRFQGGGGGGYNSFIFGNVAGDKRDPVEARELMAHETSHNFVGHTTGDTTAGGQWYSEGADVYYTNVLTYRAGLMPLGRFAENMNTLVAEYYENPLSHLSNEEVTRQFFSSHDAEVVSYQRGPLYFALVDARLRAASGDKQRVDDLVRPMVRASHAGQGATPELWSSLVHKALGEAGVEEFEAMLSGKPLDPPPDLLGPCFQREAATYRQYRPGFNARLGNGGITLVSSLQPDSPAATAGIREGDELLDPPPAPTDQTITQQPLTLHLRRNGQILTISFAAWGPPVEGWRYVRTNVPESACHI